MGKIILYSTGCPKCRVLKKKLQNAEIDYEEENDIEYMQSMGFLEVPKLRVGNKIYGFKEAVEWINNKA